MASTRVLASRLASQMATKAARPAARATLATTSKRTLTGESGTRDAAAAVKPSRSGPPI
jgi:F-type H+-transporting ATPase subunit c